MATSNALGSLSIDIATATGNLAIAFYFSWRLAVVLVATVPVSLGVLKLLGRGLKPAVQAQKEEQSRAAKYAAAAIANIDLVKACNGVDEEVWQYSQSIRRTTRQYLIQARAAACQQGYAKLWIECMFVMGFYYGAVLVNDGASPGEVLTAFYAALAALQAVEAIVPMYSLLVKGMSAGQELSHIVADVHGGCGSTLRTVGFHKPSSCAGDIEINAVSLPLLFYSTNPLHLHSHPLFPIRPTIILNSTTNSVYHLYLT